jgi:hypothetical protein
MVMIKKRAMAKDKWGDGDWVMNDVKRLETGYANNQPKWPYWVKPLNYSADEWLDMSNWITETMGKGDWSSAHTRCIGSDLKYWFRDAADRTFFILRWS